MTYPTPYPEPTTEKVKISAVIGEDDYFFLFRRTFPQRGAIGFCVARYIQHLAEYVKQEKITLSIGNEQQLIRIVEGIEFGNLATVARVP